eukprot:3808136-Rhodomonas_salina.1
MSLHPPFRTTAVRGITGRVISAAFVKCRLTSFGRGPHTKRLLHIRDHCRYNARRPRCQARERERK